MPDWYSVVPDCVKTNVPPTDGVALPYQDCHGYFTFGPGTAWAGPLTGQPIPEGGQVGDVLYSSTTALYIITAIGIAVSIAFFILWVVTENRKLVQQAERLRAAAGPPAGQSGPPTGTTFE